MPNKDWYWDRFDVDVKQGQLDLSDAKTSAIRNNKQINDTTANKYETKFIDELYGTDNRAWDTAHGKEPTQGAYSTTSWQHSDPAISSIGGSSITWGLDLVRDWTDHDFEKYPVGTNEHYEHQTRGKVDWAHYYDDNAYQAAFKDWQKDNDVSRDNLEDWMTDTRRDPRVKGRPTTQSKIDFLEYAKTHEAKEEESGLPDTWDNKYVDQFDPETATPYQATYLDVPNLWGAAQGKSDWETPDTPISVVKPASLPTLDSIKRRQVEVPDSIKNFGEAKSAPTAKFTAGGAES